MSSGSTGEGVRIIQDRALEKIGPEYRDSVVGIQQHDGEENGEQEN